MQTRIAEHWRLNSRTPLIAAGKRRAPRKQRGKVECGDLNTSSAFSVAIDPGVTDGTDTPDHGKNFFAMHAPRKFGHSAGRIDDLSNVRFVLYP